MKLVVVLYLLIIVFGRILQAIFNKRTSNALNNLHSFLGFTTFQFFCSCIPGLLIILFSGNGLTINFPTVILATLLGTSMFLNSTLSLLAMKSGTVAISSMFSTAGLLVPLIAGIFLFNAPINIYQWLGVVIFFLATYFLIGSSKKIYKNFSYKTIFLLLGSLCFSGLSALAQQLFTFYVPNGDVNTFTFLSFFIVFILGFIVFICTKKPQIESENTINKKALLLSGIALAIAVFLINQFVTLSTALIPPVILFTFANGVGTIISTIVAAILYKEKLTKQSITGVLLGIASFIIIKMF